MMCLEERSLRKTRRIKVQGAEAKGNTLAKWGEMPSFSFLKQKGEEHHNHMTVKFYTGVENSDLICSHWQPPCLGLSLNCQQVSVSHDTRTGRNVGNPQGHWNPVSTITEQDVLSLSTPGSKLSYFLISNQPSSPVLQMPSLIKVKQD